MKAAVVEGPNCLVVKEVAEPPAQNEYQAKCAILFGATCTGTDLHIISDTLPWEQPYPTIIGHESIGRVVELGSKVRNYKVGDLIFSAATRGVDGIPDGWGGFAETCWITDGEAMTADGLEGEANARVLPGDLDPAAATMLLTWAEGYGFVKGMGIGSGATVLILGSGGNGLAMTAAARALGATRVVMSGNVARADSATAVGVDLLVDYKAPDSIDQLKAAQPAGYDFVIDVVGTKGLLDSVLDLIKRGATVSAYGLDDAFDACTLTPRFRPSFTWFDGEKDMDDALDAVIALMQSGEYDARHWIDCENPFELDEIAQVYDDLKERRLPHSKAVIRVRG